jgi:hypothetical protein
VSAELLAEIPEHPQHESDRKSCGNKIRESNQNAAHKYAPASPSGLRTKQSTTAAEGKALHNNEKPHAIRIG